jgi:S1-C subfamily serine protease
MKKRILVIAALLAGGFVYLTSNSRWFGGLSRAVNESNPLWSGPSAHAAGLSTDELNNIDIYKQALGATVNITSTIYKRDFFWNVFPVRESGSGFLVNDDGMIITNNHVVSGSAKVQVTLPDKTRYEAQILNRDPANDLAIIKIEPRKKFQTLRLGDSDRLQVGQKVLAIGNPFGLEGTLTTGIISSLGRDIQDESGRVLEGMMQTDAAINPGNSGGPLLDSQGNVIGVNTAIYGPGGNIGIGFAMPINRVKQMMDGYQVSRKTGRPRLGVNGVPISGDLAEALDLPREGGFLVYDVTPDSSAADVRIRGAQRWVVIGNYEVGIGGDLIMAIDGKAVDRSDAIARVMATKRPGDSVVLTIYRAGRKQNVTVPLRAGRDQTL